MPPSHHITEVHRILKRLTGQAEPFAQRRRQANDAGLRIAARVAEQAGAMADPADRFRYLALWALAANSLDSRTAGTGYAFDPAAAYDYSLLRIAPIWTSLSSCITRFKDGARARARQRRRNGVGRPVHPGVAWSRLQVFAVRAAPSPATPPGPTPYLGLAQQASA